jgi:hypothetical protein
MRLIIYSDNPEFEPRKLEVSTKGIRESTLGEEATSPHMEHIDEVMGQVDPDRIFLYSICPSTRSYRRSLGWVEIDSVDPALIKKLQSNLKKYWVV